MITICNGRWSAWMHVHGFSPDLSGWCFNFLWAYPNKVTFRVSSSWLVVELLSAKFLSNFNSFVYLVFVFLCCEMYWIFFYMHISITFTYPFLSFFLFFLHAFCYSDQSCCREYVSKPNDEQMHTIVGWQQWIPEGEEILMLIYPGW